MKKLFNFFLQLIVALQISLFFPQNAAAAAMCTLTTSPSPVTTNERTINIEVKTTGLVEGNEYWVKLDNKVVQESGRGGYKFKVVNNTINIINVNEQAIINPDPANKRTFEAKSYSLTVQDPTSAGTPLCNELSFTIGGASSGGACQISFLNTSFTENDNIRIKADGLGGKPEDERKVILKRYNQYGIDLPPTPMQATDGQLLNGIDLGKHERGYYYVEIRDSYKNPFSQRSCFTAFGIPQGPVASINPSFNPACEDNNCNTALGPISTNPSEFVTRIFGILLSVAGGIALLLIMVSGYRLMASQGNPEKVQAAREQLTSAIVGLLFIIFSLSILQIIGIDILRIPGFTK